MVPDKLRFSLWQLLRVKLLLFPGCNVSAIKSLLADFLTLPVNAIPYKIADLAFTECANKIV